MAERRKTDQVARDVGQSAELIRSSVAQATTNYKKKSTTTTSTSSIRNVKDARELLCSRPPAKNFPQITFDTETTKSERQQKLKKTNDASGTDGQLQSVCADSK